MLKIASRLLTLLLIVCGVYACNYQDNENLLPPITGKAGEVVLVMADNLYDGFVGDSIAKILTQQELALPQTGFEGAEPIFDLVQIPPDAFSNVFRSHRNIIIAQLNPELSEGKIKLDRSYWAAQQILIRMEAPSKEAFIKLLYDNEDFLVKTIRDAEVDRQVYLNRKYENTELHRSLLANHEIITHFPKGYEALVDTGNFAWIQHEPQEIIQGVLIWDYPYVDEAQTEYGNLIAKQDEMLKPRVKGEIDGSYMAVEFRAPIYSTTLTHEGNFVREIKGLWAMEGDSMGGPFVSWTLIDEKRNRLVTLFGFVYAPKYEKRNHIRKVESLLKTVSFPD